MADLKVADDEFLSLAEGYEEAGKKIDEYINSYIEILDNICENAIQSGEVYKNLSMFKDDVSSLKGMVSSLTESLKKETKLYVEKVDEADSYIY